MKAHTIPIRLAGLGNPDLPPDVRERFGYVGGAAVRLEERGDAISMGRSAMDLARVYVEPTTACHLQCATCVRNV